MSMDRADGVELRERLISLLERAQGSPNDIASDPLLRRSGNIHSLLLQTLAHLEYEEPDAERHWLAIRGHRLILQRQIGRDPGLAVAALDYFHNLRRELTNPKLIEMTAYDALRRDAVSDGLTGLFNRRHFHTTLRVEAKRARRYDSSFTVVLLDLDDFKAVNDTYGHLVGDEALATVAEIVRTNLRAIDVACRYGGEEFAVLLPETDREGAVIVTERIRADVEGVFRERRFGNVTLALTVSGGLSCFPMDSIAEQDLLARADQALYVSKRRGKNQISIHPDEKRRSLRFGAGSELMLKPTTATFAVERVMAKNLSRNGALVETRRPLTVGTDLEICIRVRPASRDYVVRGRVVRLSDLSEGSAKRYDLGIAFLINTETERREIELLTREFCAPPPRAGGDGLHVTSH